MKSLVSHYVNQIVMLQPHALWYDACLEKEKKNPFPSTSEYTLHSGILGPTVKILIFMWFFNFLHYHIIQYHLLWAFLSPFVCWQRELQNRTIHYLIQFPRPLTHWLWGPYHISKMTVCHPLLCLESRRLSHLSFYSFLVSTTWHIRGT